MAYIGQGALLVNRACHCHADGLYAAGSRNACDDAQPESYASAYRCEPRNGNPYDSDANHDRDDSNRDDSRCDGDCYDSNRDDSGCDSDRYDSSVLANARADRIDAVAYTNARHA